MEDTSELLDWSSLPADLLREILARLPWSSHPSFAATCKHWRSVVAPFYPAWLTPLLLNAVDVGSTNFRYYSPYHHKIFEVSTPKLERPDARIHCTNGHKLTLCRRADAHDGDGTIVVQADLVTGDIHDLCPLERPFMDFLVYDGERTILGIVGLFLYYLSRTTQSNDGGWHNDWELLEYTSDELDSFRPSPMTNPVIHHGLIYLLGVDGKLAVLDNQRYDEGFRLLVRPEGFGDIECDDSYLLESDEGDLMAVLMGHRGTPLHVVKLNETTMEWETVQSLEGRALFSGTLRTMMVKTDVKWMQNRVIFPRLYCWPDVVQCNLVDREGELAFVPKSPVMVPPQDGSTSGKNIWTSGLGQGESLEFWGSASFDYCIWVNFDKPAY